MEHPELVTDRLKHLLSQPIISQKDLYWLFALLTKVREDVNNYWLTGFIAKFTWLMETNGCVEREGVGIMTIQDIKDQMFLLENPTAEKIVVEKEIYVDLLLIHLLK